MDKEYLDNFKLVPPGKYTKIRMANCKARSFQCGKLSKVSTMIDTRLVNLCKWCNDKVVTGNRHYCTKECQISCYVWVYPGRTESRKYLMHRQDYKCAICSYDWGEQGMSDGSREPETDHIVAIVNGGESLGVDNLQVICKYCHKKKTNKDLGRKQ